MQNISLQEVSGKQVSILISMFSVGISLIIPIKLFKGLPDWFLMKVRQSVTWLTAKSLYFNQSNIYLVFYRSIRVRSLSCLPTSGRSKPYSKNAVWFFSLDSLTTSSLSRDLTRRLGTPRKVLAIIFTTSISACLVLVLQNICIVCHSALLPRLFLESFPVRQL